MKLRTLFKDTYREILRSRERFISIFLITFLSVGFFVGVKATAPSMRATAENYFNSASLMDLEIISTVGFDDGDATAIRALKGVTNVMPSYSADLVVLEEGGNSVARVAAINSDEDKINRIKLVSGRMPEKPGECLAAAYRMRDTDVAIGDILRFSETTGSVATDTIISGTNYTVVGLVESPQYISYSYGTSSIGNGIISYYIMLPASEFKYARYTELYVMLDRAAGVTAFDKRYDFETLEASSEIGDVGQVRYNLFLDDVKLQLADAESELNTQKSSANQQLLDAKAELDLAKQELDESRAELDKGYEDYDNAVQTTNAEFKKAEADLRTGRAQITEGEKQLALAQSQYDAGEAELSDARRQLDSGWAQYNRGEAEYKQNEQKYNDGLKQYQDAKKEYDQAKAAYDTASEAVAMAQAALNGEDVDQEEAQRIFNEAQAALDAYIESGGSDPGTIAMLQAQIQAAIDRIENSEDQQEQAQIELENAQKQLEEYEKQLQEAEKELDAAEQELAQARMQLDDAKAKLDAAKSELQQGEAEYDAGKAKLDDANEQIKVNKIKLNTARADLAAGEAEYKKQKISAAEQLEEAKVKLESGEAEWAAGKKEYDAGYAEYLAGAAEAESKIADGSNRIQNIRNKFSEIETGKWYVFTRDDIIQSYAGFNQDAERVDAIAAIFPVFFLLVAALVCLTTMSRMIEEQRVQIGTYKALGYSSAQIAGKYMVYSAIACIIGSVLGQLICIQILPRVIVGAYSALYRLPDIEIRIPWGMSILSVIVALICTVMVAWYSCYRELKSVTASLMRPKMPRSGRKIFLEHWTKLWSKMSFSQKITARNLFRYKLRLMMTVLGISGCMALIVAGFGMHDGVNPIVDKQYGEINRYKIMFTLSKDMTRDEANAMGAELKADERLSGELFSKVTPVDVDEKGAPVQNVFVYTPEDASKMDQLITLRSSKSGNAIRLGDEGVVITDKLSDVLGLKAGDTIAFTVNEEPYALPITAVTENYIYHYIYMSPALYEKTFATDVKFNTIACAASGNMTDFERFASDYLSKSDSILSIVNLDIARKSFEETINSINIIILVMLIAAGALAFVVVFNLTNINISERTREIATIKVLGFKHSETNMYIFRENFVMGAVGIMLGSVFGYFLAQFMLKTVEVDMVKFVKDIEFTSYLFAALLTAFYIVLVNLMMTKRMRGISMVESLKAIE